MRYLRNNNPRWPLTSAALILAVHASWPVYAFDSGSTGADGALNPATDTVVVLPPDGVLNYTTVNIPSGVTVTFQRNVINTPVVMLATGDVTIDGTLSVDGQASPGVGSAGDGNPADDGDPGLGGPGGFAGGQGGTLANPMGGDGLGPGAGTRATGRHNSTTNPANIGCGGGGGGFGSAGAIGANTHINVYCASRAGNGGPSYGNSQLSPLIGGSGGGGGYAGTALNGSGGGGGGGAILIAASGTVTVNGTINARGGASGSTSGAGDANYGGTGGGGSGGAIRIVATTVAGNGALNAHGRAAGTGSHSNTNANYGRGGAGGTGRIRLEAETLSRTAATNPPYTTSAPQDLFVPGLPSLRITAVGGITAPASPTGTADITLDSATPNPVTVDFESTGVPTGTTVALKVIPASGAPSTVTSTALSGTEALATASASATIPDGDNVLQASVSFTVVASVGDNLSRFAQGERVETVTLTAGLYGTGLTQLTTVSGKTYTLPARIAAMD